MAARGGNRLELDKVYADIVRHGDIEDLFPFKMLVDHDTEELGNGSINCDIVETLDCGNGVGKIGGVGVFSAKAVNNEGKHDRACLMVPEGCSVFYGTVIAGEN